MATIALAIALAGICFALGVFALADYLRNKTHAAHPIH
jgi:hypothetical protein